IKCFKSYFCFIYSKLHMSKGVLLVNLGSPDSTETKDVRKYLDEFLMDKRVIDSPYLVRAFVVKGIILNTRPKQSAEAYKKIWWDEGSPLIVISERFKDKVTKNSPVPVALGMRYGSMSIKKGLQELKENGVTEVLLRSEEHTSELQSRENLVCRLLLEKKNITENDLTLFT